MPVNDDVDPRIVIKSNTTSDKNDLVSQLQQLRSDASEDDIDHLIRNVMTKLKKGRIQVQIQMN